MVVLDFVGKYHFLEVPILKTTSNVPNCGLPGHIRQHHAPITESVSYIFNQIFALLKVASD